MRRPLEIGREDLGPLADGLGVVRDVELFTLHAGELRVEVLSYGAHLVGVWLPDRDGRTDNVVSSLRHPDGSIDLAAYADPVANPHLGGIVGRYANRIAGARYMSDGTAATLVPNEGANQLHGGPEGLDRRHWNLQTNIDRTGVEVSATVVSPDGDQGHPGRVSVTAIYRVTVGGELRIDMDGHTDAVTMLSLTNHAYWNLEGTSEPDHATIAEHVLWVDADRVVVVDDEMLPIGELRDVTGSSFDLRRPTRCIELIGGAAMSASGGIDHCLVLNGFTRHPGRLAHVAELVAPRCGRSMQLHTDQPGVQVYTANHGAGALGPHAAVCLETQHLPDAPNQTGFPPAVLRPGERYRHRHHLRFSVEQ